MLPPRGSLRRRLEPATGVQQCQELGSTGRERKRLQWRQQRRRLHAHARAECDLSVQFDDVAGGSVRAGSEDRVAGFSECGV